MPRTARAASTTDLSSILPGLVGWAEHLGHAVGQGVARGIHSGLSTLNTHGLAIPAFGPKKRGRPAKVFTGVVPADRRCSVAGCPNPSRSKGLCSKHYQAARRKRMAKA